MYNSSCNLLKKTIKQNNKKAGESKITTAVIFRKHIFSSLILAVKIQECFFFVVFLKRKIFLFSKIVSLYEKYFSSFSQTLLFGNYLVLGVEFEIHLNFRHSLQIYSLKNDILF